MSNIPKFDLLQADFRKEGTHEPGEMPNSCCGGKKRFDVVLWGSLSLILTAIIASMTITPQPSWLERFSATCVHLVQISWWALLAGIISMAVLSQMPKALVPLLLGRPGTWNGILRATAAGLVLDLCNHGILLVAMGLYKRGASLGQTLAFLIASPWNSLSMTLLLSALIGWQWMLIFVLLSASIGMTTGYVVDILCRQGKLPANPHRLLENIVRGANGTSTSDLFRSFFHNLRFSRENILRLLRIGIKDSRMIVRWILLGFVMTAAVKAFVPASWIQNGFGPSIGGLFLTLLVTSIMEICTEGSTPMAAEIFHQAKAPGNAFTFLMVGAATDATEIMSLKSTTTHWMCALILPIVTIPQVLFFGWLLNLSP